MHSIYINARGELQCVYDETLDLRSLGTLEIERASFVEPRAGGLWEADLSPLGGPLLGPFAKRSQAIQAELAWIDCWMNNYHGEIIS